MRKRIEIERLVTPHVGHSLSFHVGKPTSNRQAVYIVKAHYVLPSCESRKHGTG